MSFGGFGSGGGFGSSQNQNQNSNTGFGGFGGTSNSNSNTGGGFGSTSTGGGLFGSNTSTTQNNPFQSGFGSGNSGGGFGSNTNTGGNSLFGGNKTGFGTSSGGSLFGNNTTTSSAPTGGSAFGGFGGNTSGAFGSNNTGNSLFGGNKTGFGTNTNTTSSSFGGGGFGASSNSGAFGSGTALGGQVPPCEGTGVVQFQPHTDKEGVGAQQTTNHFQTITMQQPYQRYSQEELRLADYGKNQRYGPSSGFGQSGGFGGFNNNTSFSGQNTNPFGGTSSSTGFGGQTSTTSGSFGANSGGGLFGANKPGGNLFGTSSSGTNSGGLFGAAPSTSTSSFGFGNNNATTSNASGGLFGGQQQAKPGGLFGAQSNPSTGGGGLFGGGNQNTSTTGGNPFGGTNNSTSTGGGLFGGQSNSSNQTSSFGFGQQNQNQQNKPLFGGVGQNNQQSGGLFGNNTTSNTGGGGLFGNNANQQNTGGSLFGSNTSNTQNKSLFGTSNDTQKPGGLFGQAPSTNTSNFGGFGANQNQNQGGGGLFGNLNTNNQSGSGTFGGSTNTAGGLFGNQNKPSGLGAFGNTQNQTQGNSLFGNASGNSLFGGSQNQQANQQPQALHSSLLDGNPYGQSSIWSGLPPATTQNTGPLLTPLSASQRLKERQAQPSFKFTPLSTSKYMTPPRRTGYGFSYSTYGTPSSSNSTPTGGTMASSLHGKQFTGGSFGRSMGKSYSASNLRQQYNSDSDGVLAPGAFAPGSSRYSSGSIRRLTIDKNLRTDSLFSSRLALPPSSGAATNGAPNGSTEPEPEQQAKLKKRVSFGKESVAGDQNGNLDSVNGAVVRAESDDDTVTDGPPVAPQTNGVNGSTGSEMEQLRSNELQAIPENRESNDITSKMRLPRDAPAAPDPKPGQYWMEPSRDTLTRMPKDQLKNLKGFTVGRKQCGKVIFDEAVDLTTVPLDELFGKIVVIEIRSITVYPDNSKKPPQGKGLNVPSTLRIENSWPRNQNKPSPATSGPVYEKHVQRLKRLPGTQFVSYDDQTGVWTFKVPHYTRYALDFEDEEDDSSLTPPPDTPLSGNTPAESAMDVDNTDDSSPQDDTFGYKKSLPGAFSRREAHDEDERFPGDRAAETDNESEDSEDGIDMAGSFPPEVPSEPVLNSILPDTPEKHSLDLDAEWADQLQRTISPRKQDRQALREAQGKVLIDVDFGESQKRATTNEFRTSIDLMNSLFGKHEERRKATKKQGSGGKDFEWPYAKRPKQFDPSAADLDASDIAWHKSFKPRWTPTGSLIHTREGNHDTTSTQPWDWSEKRMLSGRKGDVAVAVLAGDDEEYRSFLASWDNAHIKVIGGVPAASMRKISFIKYVEHLQDKTGIEDVPLDARIFRIAQILFDDYEDQYSLGLSRDQKQQYRHRIIKDRFTSMWRELIRKRKQDMPNRKGAHRFEESAIDSLAENDVEAACKALVKGRNFHLATLISQLKTADAEFKKSIASQIEVWKSQNVISEMTDAIRALYAICSGNTTICDGKPTAPLEDRASTFAISERFDLSWMQAFGLYLWYGIDVDDPIEKAIANFASKLASKEESAFPSADHSGPFASDTNMESPYWVLLKLYTSAVDPQSFADDPSTKEVVLPQALSSLSPPFDSRFVFQLYHALAAHLQPHVSIDHTRADQLASDFFFQLAAAGYYIGAIFPLLFLCDPRERERAIKGVLSDFATHLPTPHSGELEALDDKAKEDWRLLTVVLRIPQQWIYEAKALHARAYNDYIDELQCLLDGKHWQAAHNCLARRVAPRAIIDEEYGIVGAALARFGKELRAHADDECPWSIGGGMFGDYIALSTTSSVATSKDHASQLKRLTAALLDAGHQRFKKRAGALTSTSSLRQSQLMAGGIEELEERVAIKEMSAHVAAWVMDGRGSESPPQRDVLSLPLSADARLDVTKNVSGEYYRAMMAAAR